MKLDASMIAAGVCLMALALPLCSSAAAADAGSEPAESTFEMDTDMPHNDYRTLMLEGADPRDCMERCLEEDRCKAWTFVAASRAGAKARCWLKSGVGNRVKRAGIVSGEVTRVPAGAPVQQSASAGKPSSSMEVNTNRPGRDYRSVTMSSPRPDLCMETCLGEARCMAWTFVPPGRQGAQAKCWLKSGVPRSTRSPGMASGVVTRPSAAARAVESRPAGPNSTMERETNRPGRDYRNLALPDPRPEVCMETCLSEARCMAWTFVPPGRQGKQARCWLKSAAPRATRSPGMVSGVVQNR